MSETLSHASAFVPSDEELDEVERKFTDPLLTEEEVRALTDRDDRGISQTPQRQYKDLEEFKRETNNFHVHFDRENKGSGPSYRRHKAFQRFVILKPDLTQQLFEAFDRYNAQGKHAVYSADIWRGLYDAYQVMSQLVDINDGYVVGDDGQPIHNFLDL